MNIQYIYDNMGITTAIQIPIADWDVLKKKYKELEQEEISIDTIPTWQIELGKIELKKIANGTAGLIDWETAKTQFKF